MNELAVIRAREAEEGRLFGRGQAIPVRLAEGWQAAAQRIQFKASLGDAINLTKEQYEGLHDRKPIALPDPGRRRFAISRVGDRYDPTFQDLCVEYYEYVA